MKYLSALTAVAVLAVLTGCGGGIKTFPVTGKITDDKGNPIESAAVTFHPDNETAIAVGITDASGTYVLKSKGQEGAQAGSYRVTIAKYEGSADDEPTTTESDLDDPYDITDEYPDNYNEAAESAKGANEFSKNELPPEFADPNKSGLTATVAEEENTIDFQVKK